MKTQNSRHEFLLKRFIQSLFFFFEFQVLTSSASTDSTSTPPDRVNDDVVKKLEELSIAQTVSKIDNDEMPNESSPSQIHSVNNVMCTAVDEKSNVAFKTSPENNLDSNTFSQTTSKEGTPEAQNDRNYLEGKI